MVTVMKNMERFNQSKYHEYLIDSEDDVQALPTTKEKRLANEVASPGSIAYTPSLSHIYMLNAANKWVEI